MEKTLTPTLEEKANVKADLILNSKVFRKWLKSVQDLRSGLHFEFAIKDGEIKDLYTGAEYFGLSNRGTGTFMIESESISRLVKALKHISEQPIKLTFNSGSITLMCQV